MPKNLRQAINLHIEQVDAPTVRIVVPDVSRTCEGLVEKYFAAISDYDTAIRLEPDDAKAYVSRRIAKWNLDRTLEAKQDLRIAIQLAIKAGDTKVKTAAEGALRDLNQ